MAEGDVASGRKRVLVVGGTGRFGGHLVRGLVATTEFQVVIGGRDRAKSEAFALELQRRYSGRDVEAATINRERVDADTLRSLGLFAVVDAAGPFQGNSYDLPRAAIAAGVHYVDLADARDFVAGFIALDEAANRAGVVAISGASSTPALSNAALDRLTAGWRSVDTIEVGISPGNRAPRGLSVVSAILSYVGRPIRVFVDLRWQERPGWGMLVRKSMPGLGKRWLSLCETPDLDLLHARFKPHRSAIFRAGLELTVLHLGLWAASFLVRLGLLRSLRPLAPIFRRLADLLIRLGSDRGGMLVEVRGTDGGGRAVMATWSLVAEGGDGPVIPTLPALELLRRLKASELSPGARPCVGLLSLDAIEKEFSPYRIATQIKVESADLFARAVSGFERIPTAIRAGHLIGNGHVLRGRARVDGAETLPGAFLGSLFGLPRTNDDVTVTVTMHADGDREIWTRDFGGRRFRSFLAARAGGGLTERFGLLTFDLEVPTSEQGLAMTITGCRLGPIRFPQALSPRTEAREDVDEEGRFRFDVTIALPSVGRLVRYRGWLVPDRESTAS
jgi:saccharopine dehydrogenase-like NADP-dependent oxidoreductase